MKICCISDTHGHLPIIPECDLLLIAGDICPCISPIRSAKNFFLQANFLRNEFVPWLNNIKANIVFTPGNHDGIFEESNKYILPQLPCIVLINECAAVNGLKICGFPYQLPFNNWFFNLDESGIAHKLRYIPDDIDIMLLHSPPYGIGDFADQYNEYPAEHIGSHAILDKINSMNSCKLIVFGHCHEGYGIYNIGDKIFTNASYTINARDNKNEPILIGI